MSKRSLLSSRWAYFNRLLFLWKFSIRRIIFLFRNKSIELFYWTVFCSHDWWRRHPSISISVKLRNEWNNNTLNVFFILIFLLNFIQFFCKILCSKLQYKMLFITSNNRLIIYSRIIKIYKREIEKIIFLNFDVFFSFSSTKNQTFTSKYQWCNMRRRVW